MKLNILVFFLLAMSFFVSCSVPDVPDDGVISPVSAPDNVSAFFEEHLPDHSQSLGRADFKFSDREFSESECFLVNSKSEFKDVVADGTSDDLNLLLADWSFFDDSDYYPVINIHAVEYDRGNGYFDMSADAKIGYKASDRITLEAKGHFEFRLNHDVQDCGIAYLRYYQNPDVNFRLFKL